MEYLSPKGKQHYSHLTVLGIALIACLAGMLFTRGYAAVAYTAGHAQGKAQAQQELNVKKLLEDKTLANKACYQWWFGDLHRLSKKPQ